MAIKVSTYNSSMTGTVTINIKIPGTFATLDATQPTFVGRQLVQMTAWVEGRMAGDALTSAQIKDIDNVTGLGANTVLGSLADASVPSANQGLAFPPTGQITITPDRSNKKTNIAAGLYVSLTFTKANPLLNDNAFVNMAWDDYT